MRGFSVIKKKVGLSGRQPGEAICNSRFCFARFRPAATIIRTIRLGITITKKVGNAVVRNRMRRRFRELMREMLGEKGKAGADHILIGRDGGIERDFGELTGGYGRGPWTSSCQ